jgi:uncharacterized protein with GYD domain
MPTYVSLLTYTDQGIRNIKEAPKRLEVSKRAIKQLGGSIKAYYMTQGSYDGILIFEVPDEMALTTFLLNIGAAGNVRTTSLRAFPEEEFMKHVAALSKKNAK